MALECPDIVFYQANMTRWPNIGLLLAHRLRSWPNSKSALSQRLMFAGYVQYLLHIHVQFCHAIYIEAWVAIYQVENRLIRINVIFLGKTNTAIHDPQINGMGSSIAIIILAIMWKTTT